MNFLWFILNEPYDKNAKVLSFLELAINSPTRVKYRDAMKAKYLNKGNFILHVKIRTLNKLSTGERNLIALIYFFEEIKKSVKKSFILEINISL